jgi:hypothetical protein
MTPRIPDEWREHYLHAERSKQQLQKDLTVAFDRIAELQGQLRTCKIMLWISGMFIAGLGAVVILLANVVLERI